jgi:hypothetical protein
VCNTTLKAERQRAAVSLKITSSYTSEMKDTQSLPKRDATMEQKLRIISSHPPSHQTFRDLPPHLPPTKEHQEEEEKILHSEDDDNQFGVDEEGSTSSFIQSIKKVFAPCVGLVDVASFIMGNCRGEKGTPYEPYDMNLSGPDPMEIVMKLRQRNAAAMNDRKVQKRQGETLEFRAVTVFDDDVSAISAHTLEEMERSQISSNGIGKFHVMAPTKQPRRTRQNMLPPSMNGHDSRVANLPDTQQPWTMMQSAMNQTRNDDVDDNVSQGVSTSGSESSADAEPTTTNRVVV